MKIKELYRTIIKQVLVENNVKSIIRFNKSKENNFFDKIIVNDGYLEVYRCGLKLPNFYYDFTCDFARCLSFIEDEIFIQSRSGKPQHGYQVIFK